jgi:DtxR family transcriptional regulator, Mn-dependent transcriptional regulator
VKTTGAVEDYLKAIYHLSFRGETPSTSRIAQWLGISAPSVSGMVKRLEAGGLVARPEDGSVRLTARGEAEALRVVRRHRLLETFLVEVLGVGWDEVHDEAEVLEHALSERLEDRIDELLGHPTHDPHGDPIPPRSGAHDERWADPLAGAPVGVGFRVERVSDRDSAALRYLADLGIRPGAILEIEERAPFGGPLWVRLGGDRHALGAPLTRAVHGTVVDRGAR